MKYLSLFLLITLLTSCTWATDNIVNNNTENNSVIDNNWQNNTLEVESDIETTEFEEKEIKLDLKDTEVLKFTLDSDNTKIISDSIQVSWQIITIKKSWNYEFTWTLNNWQIVVETEDEKDVQIILNNVNITSQSSSAILVNNSNRTVINLASLSNNTLIDAKEYSNKNDDSENAAIYSKDDLVINWNWTLNVTWNYNDWITSKDKLYIDSWTINITAKDDWIRWKDYILINSWNINIDSKWDSLKSDNEEKGTVLINGWNIEISSWDDGIHAEQYIVINSWNVNINKSYEALESKDISLNWWNVNLVSSDDWINATSWINSTSEWEKKGTWRMWWWQQAEEWVFVRINGWNITINSDWDWLDSNGNIIMTWWNVIVYWPILDNNWALDYNGTFNISGWTLIAIWSSGMAETPNDTSFQNSVLIWLENSYEAWNEIIIKDITWKEIFNLISKKRFQAIVISSSDLIKDSTYSLEINWQQIEEFIISDVITTVWETWKNNSWFRR